MTAKNESATAAHGLVLREHRHCEDEEVEEVKKCVGPALVRFASYEREEKARMCQKTASAIKSSLDAKLKGNWNVLIGSDMQISVGLLPDCRLVRLECRQERLFCFETHTQLFDPKKQEEGKKAGMEEPKKNSAANGKPPAGQPQNQSNPPEKTPENLKDGQNAEGKSTQQPSNGQKQAPPNEETLNSKPNDSDKTSSLASNGKHSDNTDNNQPAGTESASKTANAKPTTSKTGNSDGNLEDNKKPAQKAPANPQSNK